MKKSSLFPRMAGSLGAGAGSTTYRLWIHTSPDDVGGKKGDVNLCLHGALGSVWLQQLQSCRPAAGHLFGSSVATEPRQKFGPSTSRCELYVAAEEVGDLFGTPVKAWPVRWRLDRP